MEHYLNNHYNKMSDSDSDNSNLEKDDEDLTKTKIKSVSAEKNKSKKKGKEEKSDDSSGNENPIYFLLKKRMKRKEKLNNSMEELPTKRKRKELTEFQRIYILSKKEEFTKNFSTLKSDFKFLEDYEKKIFQNTNLDLMFIMDLTGSMNIWLNEAKKNITNIIEEITQNNPGSKIRVSFIGYRDYETADETREYFIKEFTENISEINDYLKTLNCQGGGDLPEDVVGALKTALKMKWESDAKYAILVCDAPCHGKAYHELIYDTFENGDPNGTSLEYVMEQFKLKNINFYCLEIDSSTEKMFYIMEQIYYKEKFHREKLSDSAQFSFFVSFSASMELINEKFKKNNIKNIIEQYRKESIEEILKKYLKDNNLINNINNTEKELIEQIENLNIEEEDKKLLDFVNRMNDLNINSTDNNNINIISDNNNTNNIIIPIKINSEIIKNVENKKINYTIKTITYNKNLHIVNDWLNPSFEKSEFNTNINIKGIEINNENESENYYKIFFTDNILQIDKEGQIPLNIKTDLYNDSNKYIKHLFYDEIICQQIGDYYNILLKEKIPEQKKFMKFARHILYELNIYEKNQETKDLIMDEFCQNFKYILSEDNLSSMPMDLLDKRDLESFTHFSYQITGGQILITDLDYKNNLCNNFKIYKINEGGYKKIFEFFASHICNRTCQILELIHPRKKNNFILKDEFYNLKYLTNISLCECCRYPLAFHEKYEYEENILCYSCFMKEDDYNCTAICKKCSNGFRYSEYFYRSLLRNYPKYCKNCRNNFGI